jgi:hypothetical protein
VKTLAKLLYVEADEEITDLVDRLRDLSLEDEVTFVVPERARALQSPMSFRLLKRYADSYGKRVNLVTSDPRLREMSLETGFTAYPSLAAYDRGVEVPGAIPVGEPGVAAAAGPAVAVTAPPTTTQVVTPQRGVATLDRTREASVTSAPPKRTAPPPSKPVSSGPPLGSYRWYAIGAVVLVVLGLLAGILYLPTATAIVSVQGTAIKTDITLLGAPGAAAGSPDHFATQALHASQQQTFPGTPTGQKQIDAVKAAGQVTFAPKCDCSFQVPGGTDVSTGNSKHYVTQKTVTVGSQGTSVAVAAVQGGANGNTEANSIQYINDDILTVLAKVANPQAISGGADARTATIISQSDIDSVRDVYAKEGITQVTDQLNSKGQGLKIVLVGSGVQASATADHKVGEEVPGFTITAKVAGDAVAYDEKAVNALLKAALLHKVPQGSQLTTGSSSKYEASNATADGHITLTGHASGFYTPIFLEPAIRAHLKGMSPSKGRAFLQSLSNVVDARVTQSPFGLPWLPLFSSRITLKIQEVSSSSASP